MLEKKINELKLDTNIIKTLNDNNIITIEDLWVLKRINLKEMGLTDSNINQILIKLQLIGIGLNKKSYDNDRIRN